MYTFAIVDHLTKVFNYVLLGIRGAKGTPLPKLCFAQLAICIKCYVTDRQTDRHTPTII